MVGKTPIGTRLRAAFGALLLTVLPLRAFAEVTSDAQLFIFPLPPVGQEIDIADPGEWRQLAGGGSPVQPGDDYSFTLNTVSGSFFNQGVPGMPSTYDVLHYTSTVQFISRPAAVSPTVQHYLFLLLGFGQSTLGPTDGLAGYEKSMFFVDGVQTTPVAVADYVSETGQIPDAFGEYFIGFFLDATEGSTVDFDFTVAIRRPLINNGATFTFFTAAFIQLPEPGTGLLLGLSLLALAGLRGRRR